MSRNEKFDGILHTLNRVTRSDQEGDDHHDETGFLALLHGCKYSELLMIISRVILIGMFYLLFP